MKFIQKCLLFVFLFSFLNCDLFKKELSNLTKNIENVTSFDNNQKQAFLLFKEVLSDKQYAESFDKERQKQKELEQDNGNPDVQKKLAQRLDCDYDESKIDRLFAQLGIDRTKEFLQQLHLMIKSINDGTLTSFLNSANFYEKVSAQEMTLEQKREQALQYIKRELYIEFYFHSNDVYGTDYFFYRVMDILKTKY